MSDIGTAYIQIEPTAKGISKKIEGQMSDAGASSGSAFSSGFGKVIGGVGKLAMGAVAAGATAVGGIVTAATKNFGEYEQLVGGVETLFGDAAQTVINNADKAYESAGMSANDYMQTVTSFSASLLQSLGGDTAAAAKTADMALIDMSDNANKMGTSMESIQNAYQGFAKQNYTMLDNLKLGYGGTKSEMERLLADATKLTGVKYDISNLNDVYNAIHAVQENLGITGTTAKEASSTIQGSFASMKAEWDNLLTAMSQGDGWDMGVYIENFLETVKTFAGNVMPVVQQSLVGVSSLISGLAPEIAAAIPQMVSQVLPGLLESGVQIIDALGQGLLSAIPALMPSVMEIINSLLQMILQMLPQILQVGVDIILQLAQGITEALPSLIPAITNAVMQIVTMFTDPNTITSLLQAGIDMLLALLDGFNQALPEVISQLPNIIENLCSAFSTALPLLIDAGIQLTNMLIQNLPTIMQALIDAAPSIIESLCTALVSNAPLIVAAGPMIMLNFVNGILQQLPQLLTMGKQLIDAIIQGLASAYANLTAEGPKMLSQLLSRMKSELTKFLQTGRELVKQIIDGIKGYASNLYSTATEMMSKLKEKIVGAVKGFAEVGKQIVAGIKEGLASAWEEVVSWFKDKIDALKKSVGSLKDLVSGGDKKESSSGGKTSSVADSAVNSISSVAANAAAEYAASSNYATSATAYQTATVNDPMYTLLAQYLPRLLEKKTEVDVEFSGGLDRFFRAMQIESQKNYQLTGVVL